jgi:hypothetical protein
LLKDLPWCPGEFKETNINTFVKKIRCKHHNSSLTSVDQKAFRDEVDLDNARTAMKPAPGGPPSVAQGGRGVVVSGCATCKKKFGTMPQFMDHLTDDVLPAILDRLSQEKGAGSNE